MQFANYLATRILEDKKIKCKSGVSVVQTHGQATEAVASKS